MSEFYTTVIAQLERYRSENPQLDMQGDEDQGQEQEQTLEETEAEVEIAT